MKQMTSTKTLLSKDSFGMCFGMSSREVLHGMHLNLELLPQPIAGQKVWHKKFEHI